ncbi:MAG: hypothetical protein H8E66_00155 [Planctomycetes bacterium]|nr:hypothetical protein [Planctomycetota bacterium]
MGKKKTRGRPKKKVADSKSQLLQVRLEQSEKDGFEAAAKMAGIPLSTWVRERLRIIAVDELERYGKTPKFIKK